MRHLIIPGITALLLSVASAVWAGETYRLQVDGLACPFCAYGVEKKLTNSEGVESIDIRINEGMVLVTMRDGASFDEAHARRIIKDAGFTLKGFEKMARGDQ